MKRILRKLNVYLAEGAVRVLDNLVAQRKRLWSTSSNRSNTLSDLLLQQGKAYCEQLEQVNEAIKKYGATSLEVKETAAKLAQEPDDARLAAMKTIGLRRLANGGGER